MKGNRWKLLRLRFSTDQFSNVAVLEKLRSMKVMDRKQGAINLELNQYTVTVNLPEIMAQDVVTEAERTDGMTALAVPRTRKRKKKKR